MRPASTYRGARRNAAREDREIRYWRRLPHIETKSFAIFVFYPPQSREVTAA